MRTIAKCAMPKCKAEVWVSRLNRFGQWFNFCKEHFELIEWCAE